MKGGMAVLLVRLPEASRRLSLPNPSGVVMQFRAISGLAAVLLLGCTNPVDRFVVRSAHLDGSAEAKDDVVRAWDSRDGRFALAAHSVEEGGDVVLSKRQYFRGRMGVTDHEGFEKLSVVVQSVDSARVFDVVQDHLRVVYSAGSAAFPEDACFSYAESGIVEVKPRNSRSVYVRVDIQTHSDQRARGCGGRKIVDEAVYEVMNRSELTPWLGGPFQSLDEASFR